MLNRKITWSKNGCVAYITPDGTAVHLKVFSRNIETGNWDLGKDVTLEIPQGREHFPFVHLSWSHLGNDLVVVDAVGRVLNFSCAMALDRMPYFKAELAHPEAEADGVVGLQWLAIYPYEQKASRFHMRLWVILTPLRTTSHGQRKGTGKNGNGISVHMCSMMHTIQYLARPLSFT